MNKSNQQFTAMFHAYIDEQLNPGARAQFEKVIDENPSVQTQLMEHQNLRLQIKSSFSNMPLDQGSLDRLNKFVQDYSDEGVEEQSIPDEHDYTEEPTDINLDDWGENRVAWYQAWIETLQSRFNSLFATPQKMYNTILASGAVLVVLTIGLLLINSGEDSTGDSVVPAIEMLSMDAHRIYSLEKKHAVEVPAEELTHLMSWLSSRLNSQVGPADLESHEFQLMGGRLLPMIRKHAALYMYRDIKDNRVSLFMRQKPNVSDDNGELTCQNKAELKLCRWMGKKLVYLMVSNITLSDLSQLAKDAEKQLP